MPTRRPGESREDFVARCIPIVLDEGTAETQNQAIAICNSMWEDQAATASYVRLAGLVDAAEIRTAEFDGIEHVVVPVVALVGNIVVQGLTSPGPEFVPLEALQAAPAGWNNRPVVPDHPENGTRSANDPEMLETLSFGRIFNARVEEGRLKVEAWLDPARAATVGQDAERVIERARNKELIEVSVGAFVHADPLPGEYQGQVYEYVWRGIVPDHLAMLPEGKTGACSVEAGCGAPRLNESKEAPRMSKLSELLRHVRDLLALQGGLSDVDLRDRLHEALNSTVPGFEYIVEVFNNREGDNSVVYYAFRDKAALLLRRAFTLSDGGSVELGDAEENVERTTEYTPVSAESDGGGSSEDGTNNVEPTEPAATEAVRDCQCTTNEGVTMSQTMENLIERLVASEATPFTEACRDALAAFGEEQLEALMAKYEDPPPAEESPAPQTDEEWLESAPESVRELIARHQAQERDHRKALISHLGEAQDVYSEEALTSKTTEDLELLCRALGAVSDPPDFGGQGLPTPPDSPEEPLPIPEPYTNALEKRAN